jgi:hypothetical protein
MNKRRRYDIQCDGDAMTRTLLRFATVIVSKEHGQHADFL